VPEPEPPRETEAEGVLEGFTVVLGENVGLTVEEAERLVVEELLWHALAVAERVFDFDALAEPEGEDVGEGEREEAGVGVDVAVAEALGVVVADTVEVREREGEPVRVEAREPVALAPPEGLCVEEADMVGDALGSDEGEVVVEALGEGDCATVCVGEGRGEMVAEEEDVVVREAEGEPLAVATALGVLVPVGDFEGELEAEPGALALTDTVEEPLAEVLPEAVGRGVVVVEALGGGPGRGRAPRRGRRGGRARGGRGRRGRAARGGGRGGGGEGRRGGRLGDADRGAARGSGAEAGRGGEARGGGQRTAYGALVPVAEPVGVRVRVLEAVLVRERVPVTVAKGVVEDELEGVEDAVEVSEGELEREGSELSLLSADLAVGVLVPVTEEGVARALALTGGQRGPARGGSGLR
jgi:hypothetical protein